MHFMLTRKLVQAAALLATSCAGPRDQAAPPRSDDAPDFTPQSSTFRVPIDISLDRLQRELDANTPRRLWSIDERREACVPGQRVKAFGRQLKVTPDLGCRIVGQVNRGAIRLTGSGPKLVIVMPVNAVISARDVGGIIKRETATGSATVRADVVLGMSRDWRPTAKVDISYDWREPPGIDFLGQRIRFAQRADKELAGVIARLERDLQALVSRQSVRPIVAAAWRQGFTVIELNRKEPPAWMRITPQAIGINGYRVEGRTVKLSVAAAALAESFIDDDRPAAPSPTPLPPQLGRPPAPGMALSIPVLAEYAQLEPVVLRELRELAARGITMDGVGRVEADFRKVVIYATNGGRIAVGVDAVVEPVGERFGTRLGKANGRVWLTGLPVNAADSQVIRIADFDIYGETDRLATDLLMQLMLTDAVKARIGEGLSEDFSKDYNRVVAAARKAVRARQEGDFRISATIREVHHGRILATGQGLFLSVAASGNGEIAYNPR